MYFDVIVLCIDKVIIMIVEVCVFVECFYFVFLVGWYWVIVV